LVGMTNQTVVSVYGVDASGATGARRGMASLIHPQLVLVHPKLSGDLAAQGGESAALRVGIAYPAGSGHAVEVIEVTSVHIEDPSVEPGADRLVALLLQRTVTGAVEPLVPATEPVPDVEGFVAAARRRLVAEHFVRKPEEHFQEDDPWWPQGKPKRHNDGSIPCKVFGVFCWKREDTDTASAG
jgi:hypothetical protein